MPPALLGWYYQTKIRRGEKYWFGLNFKHRWSWHAHKNIDLPNWLQKLVQCRKLNFYTCQGLFMTITLLNFLMNLRAKHNTKIKHCCQLGSELAGLCPNSDFFWKTGPKKVWIDQQTFDFSAKVAYLNTCPEYKYGTYIPAWTLDNLKIVKLWKRVWFSQIFGPILVWFSLKMRSELGPNLEI